VLYSLERSGGQTKALVACLVGLPLLAWVVAEILTEKRQSPRTSSGAGPGSALTLLAQAMVGAFEGVLGYFANTISFVRLAAYAMSHAAVLVAAFSLAGEMHQLPAGGLLAVVVIVAGNLVAILLEGTIASVQALRLEYYEFFSKFFSGEGTPFRPFQLPSLSSGLQPLHQTNR
jgi:V/A-type H+-transporting ATPase subunit I